MIIYQDVSWGSTSFNILASLGFIGSTTITHLGHISYYMYNTSMAPDSSSYLSPVWSSSLFTDRVVFCTGGAGTICSAQVRALVHLGANACIIGRNVDKTVNAAKDIATCRSGAKVIGIGGVDVRDPAAVAKAVERCVAELGAVDYLM